MKSIEMLEILKTDAKKETIFGDYLDPNGNWCISFTEINEWKIVKEIPRSISNKYRYFLGTDDNKTMAIYRTKK